jgi:phospholipase C
MGLENIEHIVVVMFENRSFDNLLGWLYDAAHPPRCNIPADPANPPTFEGLTPAKYFNTYAPAPGASRKVPVTQPTQAWPPSCPQANQVPTPDPNEEFDFVTNQLFGTKNPVAGAMPDMSGFLQDYATAKGVQAPEQIMQTYSPTQASVINQIAKNFAVCDHWFAPVPSQTWPNRGFMHSGCSDGHLNNDDSDPYDIPTIFNILEDQGKTWGVFHDTTIIPALTLVQFLPRLAPFEVHFHKYTAFQQLCGGADTALATQKLPAYSFIEPRFVPEPVPFKLEIDYPSDYHPPHNICRGEQFLADVYQSIRNSPYRDKILLIITFDEHGGCYDHVPPPNGAAPPDPGTVSRETIQRTATPKFVFDRYGVRVPAIVVSSYVEPGTVFRANAGEAPYDHTSILATVRDWPFLKLDQTKFLPSRRIVAAPTLNRVLTRIKGNEIGVWPDITAQCVLDGSDAPSNTPVNGLQQNLLAAAKAQITDTSLSDAMNQARGVQTYNDALNFLQPTAS